MFYQGEKGAIFRQELWSILRHGRGRTGHAYTFVSATLILLSVAILPLEFLTQIQQYHNSLIVIEIVLTAIFTVDYLLHLYSTPSRMKYVLSFYGIVDLLSILPFFLGLLGTQYLRVFRLVRLVRVGEFEAAASEDEKEIIESGIGVGEEEKVEYIVSHHPLYLLANAIPSMVATTFAVAIMLLFNGHPVSITVATILLIFSLIFLWRTWLNFSYDVIYVTNHRLVFYDQFLLGRSINQVNYHAITNVQPSYTSVFGYIFGYGLLTIETPATEQGRIELNVVKAHEKAAHVIMKKCVTYRRSEGTNRPQPSQSADGK
jgi:hypothetical protein